ncbi:MAG TPA: hypothetical protein VGF86_12640 [Candidatus Tumulicola sp.]|jgi:hypothetical protein
MTRDFGRHAYGVAAIIFGVLTLYWHDVNAWQQAQPPGSSPYREPLIFIAAAATIAGGVAIQWRRTAPFGAIALSAYYLVFALSTVPPIVGGPTVYDHWGNFFEQFSMFSGALVAYASLMLGRAAWAARVAGIGRALFGICVVSFTLEQAFYLSATAGFVPKWIPPGQTFWAIATTIAFALAAIAILSGRQALLASRLLTAMILLFGLLIWLPTLLANPHSHFNWAESVENLAIAGAAWILADSLSASARTLRTRP